MPSMWTFGGGRELYPPDRRLGTDVELISPDGSDNQSYLTGSTSSDSDFNAVRSGHVNSGSDGLFSPCQLAKRDGRRTTVILIISSIFMLLFVTALSLGLGGYSVLIHKPAPVIDKSVDAFSIPNHKASKLFHALRQAQSRQTSAIKTSKRSKRDTNRIEHLGHSTNRLPWMQTMLHADKGIGQKRELAHFSGGHLKIENFNKKFRSMQKMFRRSADKFMHGDEMLHLNNRHARERRSTYWNRCREPQECIHWKLQVIFIATGNEDPGNMFTRERLETVHGVEQKIINHPGFTDHCWKDSRLANQGGVMAERYNGCAPLNSLMTYFFPSTASNGKIRNDGLGSNIVDIDSALKKAMTHKEFYYFVDENINSTSLKSRIIRTEVLFGAPLKGYTSFGDRKDEQGDKYKEFLVSYIDVLSKASTSKVQVLYGGNELFDYEVESTFWSDLRLAKYALIFIWLFVFVLTSFSIWLTFWGMVAIFLSFPLAFFFYRVAFDIQGLGILNGAAAFVVIGIGVDDVFVFVNTFRQSQHMDRIRGRLLYTIKTAGKATFFTSFTTAAAFAANIASSIPALHEFGLFMALIVVCCWLSVALLLPPVLYLWHLVFAWIDGLIIRCFKYILYKVILRREVDALQVPPRCDREEVNVEETRCSVPFDDDDDVPMLQMDNEPNIEDSVDGDEPLLVPYVGSGNHTFGGCAHAKSRSNRRLFNGDTSGDSLDGDEAHLIPYTFGRHTPESRPDKRMFDLGHYLQRALCNYVVRPIIHARWVVTVVYVVLLIISVGLITQIKLSSKPPQLFKENTNLQMMLDLKANLSIDKVSCPRCSGMYTSHDYSKPSAWVPSNIPPKYRNYTNPNVIPTNYPYPPTGSPPGRGPAGHLTQRPQQPGGQKQNGSDPHHTHQKPQTVAPHKPITLGHDKFTSKTKPFTTRPGKFTTAKPAHTTYGNNPTKGSASKHPNPPATHAPHSPSDHTGRSSERTTVSPHSLPPGYNVCEHGSCGKAEKRPVMDSRAVVYVVFGIKGLDRSGITSDHVISDNYGEVVYDPGFPQHFTTITKPPSEDDLKELCSVCKLIASNSDLVINGSAQCLPPMVERYIGHYLQLYPECQNLPKNLFIYNQRAPAQADARITDDKSIKWMAFAFESTTPKGQSYFQAYQDYIKWETFIAEIKSQHLRKDSPLQAVFQTSEFWTKVLMEVICVSSAIYGVVLSMFICVVAVAIFTGHILLLLVVVLTIGGVICLVVALFFVAGWEMGAVEAVSLSILVGSSVDYCVHVVEGYILAGESPEMYSIQSAQKMRRFRVLGAVQHIGVSILSSALTTIVAAIPLTQTTIQPFARFGDIVAMNTSFSILYALTACTAFLAIFGPAKFRSSWKSTGIAVAVTGACAGVSILVLFILSRAGVNIPSPNGGQLFPK